MQSTQDLLRSFPLLEGLSDDELQGAPTSRVERGAGERFFEQDDPGDAVYGVVRGRVQVAKRSLDGKEYVLDVFGPGELVAAVAVLQGVPMPASATALEPTTCLRIEGAWFKRATQSHPELVGKTLDVMMSRLLEAGTSRLRLATAPVEARLAAALLRMGKKFGEEQGSEILIRRAFTRQNLADLAGTTVETTIRIMSRWTRDRWIDSEAGRIRIRNPEELRRLAEI
jgi:CRP/FNR family transcriptional regulator